MNGILLKAEKQHYQKLLDDYKNNLKKSWSVIKEVINKKKTKRSCSRFFINGKLNTNKKEISNGFNSFFTNVGPTLAAKIPSDGQDPIQFMKNKGNHDMAVDFVTRSEVIKIVSTLKEGSNGWDDLSSRIIKSTYDSFIIPLTHVLNVSITKGIFPEE